MLLDCFQNRIRHVVFRRVLGAVLLLIIFLIILTVSPPAICRQQAASADSGNQKNNVARLEPGIVVEKTLAGGETDSYAIQVGPGQFLHAVVEQLGIDVFLTLYGPDGKPIASMHSPHPAFGLEQISTITDSNGAYRLNILSREKSALAGHYRVSISPPRAPTNADRARISAERTFFEAVRLFQKGDVESLRDAIQRFDATLLLWRTARDDYENALTLNNIGRVYEALGEKQKALDYYGQALPLERAVGDRSGEAATLNNIGLAYDALGEKQKALDYYDQALPLRSAVGDRSGEATTLNNIGLVYSTLGEKQKALDYYDQALPLERAVGDRSGEATTLNNVGAVYDQLGEKQKALDYYDQALPLRSAVGDRSGEATTLNNIGLVYDALGERQKALDYYNQALPLLRAVGNRSMEATTLNNIGLVYDALGEKQKALDYYNQALPLLRAVGNRSVEATTLDNIGFVYDQLGEKLKAFNEYSRSLAVSLEVRDPLIQRAVLGNLMTFCRNHKQPEAAVFFGKQAINRIQQIRANIGGMEKEAQHSFLKSNEDVYRELAALLISQGRLPEAEQVLNLLKNEEYFEFIRRDGKEASSLTAPVSLTKSEETLSREYEENAGRVTAVGNEWAALRAKPSRTPEEEQHLAELSVGLQLANQQWEKFLNGLYAELGTSKQAQVSVENLQESASGMQRVVRELGPGAVALYTLVGEEKYRVIVVTPTVVVAREYPIQAADLRRKVFEFRLALTNPKSNPVAKAQELYGILFGPIAQDVEGAKAVTLMWSLDDVLRYLPMAALHDDHQYLVEKYRNTVFTPANVADLTKRANVRAWHGVGMGVSKSYGQFPPLPAVPEELRRVIREENTPQSEGILPGEVMLDEKFTENSMKKALEYKYPLVHIASHFGFNPGNETNSFLLLGGKDAQGAHLTLAEIRQDPGFTFTDTELLTLSACDTAMGGPEGDGREVDGLGILAQQKGAKAVVASLWGVHDTSTGLLMQKFYKAWTTRPNTPKAEALRQAQVAVLRGTLSARDSLDLKSDKDKGRPASGSGSGKDSDRATYAHPYYWAPFILIGNWR
jgi:CHAT domain-containing protein/Tfp pilus assembly protein PilF